RITNMVAKELRLIVKDKVALLLIFVLPVALIGMLAYVSDQADFGEVAVEEIDPGSGGALPTNETSSGPILGVIDLDTTRMYDGPDLSENYTDALREIAGEIIIYNNTDDAYLDLYNGLNDGYVVIPDGFEENLTLNQPTYVELHIDATDMFSGAAIQGTVQGATILFRVSKLWIRSEVFPQIVTEFSPPGGYIESVFGSFIIVFSSYLGIAMTAAQSIVGDTPLRRMLLTPTNRLEVIVAKVLGYLIIGFFQSILLISLWVIAFDLALNTDFLTLVIIMSLIALTGSTTGLLISAIAGTRLQANQIFLFILFASIILSGFFIDVGTIDDYLPLNQGMKLLLDTTLKGLSLLDVWWPIAKLGIFTVGAILAATYIFSKKPTLG
ncbi:MAG: ABC transporter permease, partial [Candidatus Thorarchaeota archaeon]|nr:ABC transporter permease [Candidatus Thorarchaeota archaeon]